MKSERVDIMLAHQYNCLFFDHALKGLSIPSNRKIVMDEEERMHLLTDKTTEVPAMFFPAMNMPGKSDTTNNSLRPINRRAIYK